MSKFTLHDHASAPADSKPLLENSVAAFGMIPNLHAVMAESPQLLEGYQKVHELFSHSSFDKNELTVVWQTINQAHNCHYCLPAHSMVAQMMNADMEINKAVRAGTKLPTEKLEVLRSTTLAMVMQRGVLLPVQEEAFFGAGYTRQHLLDIVLGIAQKVMSNYTNHVADTPVDEPFKAFL